MKLWVGDERLIAVGEGNGPVNALDQALRRVLDRAPTRSSTHIHLTDYRVRILDGDGRHRRRRAGAHRLHRRRAGVDHHRRVAPTSSRRRGRPSPTPWCSACSTPANRFAAVAAPEYVPVDRNQPVRAYESPPRRPESWLADRPGELVEAASPAATSSATRAPTRATCSRWPAASRASSR